MYKDSNVALAILHTGHSKAGPQAPSNGARTQTHVRLSPESRACGRGSALTGLRCRAHRTAQGSRPDVLGEGKPPVFDLGTYPFAGA